MAHLAGSGAPILSAFPYGARGLLDVQVDAVEQELLNALPGSVDELRHRARCRFIRLGRRSDVLHAPFRHEGLVATLILVKLNRAHTRSIIIIASQAARPGGMGGPLPRHGGVLSAASVVGTVLADTPGPSFELLIRLDILEALSARSLRRSPWRQAPP